MDYVQKRRRPKTCQGWTRKFELGDNSDLESNPNLYVTFNVDDEGELFEVFIKRGKAGTKEDVYCEALARQVSLSLRCWIDPRDISEQMRGLAGPNPIWEAPEIEGQKAILLLSVPHCVSLAIDEWLAVKAGEITIG